MVLFCDDEAGNQCLRQWAKRYENHVQTLAPLQADQQAQMLPGILCFAVHYDRQRACWQLHCCSSVTESIIAGQPVQECAITAPAAFVAGSQWVICKRTLSQANAQVLSAAVTASAGAACMMVAIFPSIVKAGLEGHEVHITAQTLLLHLTLPDASMTEPGKDVQMAPPAAMNGRNVNVAPAPAWPALKISTKLAAPQASSQRGHDFIMQLADAACAEHGDVLMGRVLHFQRTACAAPDRAAQHGTHVQLHLQLLDGRLVRIAASWADEAGAMQLLIGLQPGHFVLFIGAVPRDDVTEASTLPEQSASAAAGGDAAIVVPLQRSAQHCVQELCEAKRQHMRADTACFHFAWHAAQRTLRPKVADWAASHRSEPPIGSQLGQSACFNLSCCQGLLHTQFAFRTVPVGELAARGALLRCSAI